MVPSRMRPDAARPKVFWDATLGPSLARVFDHVVCLSEAEREDVNGRWRALRVALPTDFRYSQRRPS